jgi:hypothetical protein
VLEAVDIHYAHHHGGNRPTQIQAVLGRGADHQQRKYRLNEPTGRPPNIQSSSVKLCPMAARRHINPVELALLLCI